MSQNNYNGYDYGDDAELVRQKQQFGGGEMAAGFAGAEERIGFITKTYLYVIGSIFALVGIEAILLNTVEAEGLVGLMLGSRFSWIVVLLLFMGVSAVANVWANSSTSSLVQHLGLGLYIVAQSIILLPLLWLAQHFDKSGGMITSAGIATGGLFSLMTIAVFLTRADFSFLRTALVFGGLAFLGAIIFCPLFGFSLGPIFMYVGITLACGYILYDTSNVLHHYRTDQHVAAALALFASVVLLFWYILQLFMSSND
ncbi:MAG: Bax inhibitor-1 family protein [Planctomycetaceae bacterium]|jgi:FtsH-binding integral membrane protein|nr:Bax inhibitor-1 family protein [Planctomycetaceae bacterium]